MLNRFQQSLTACVSQLEVVRRAASSDEERRPILRNRALGVERSRPDVSRIRPKVVRERQQQESCLRHQPTQLVQLFLEDLQPTLLDGRTAGRSAAGRDGATSAGSHPTSL